MLRNLRLSAFVVVLSAWMGGCTTPPSTSVVKWSQAITSLRDQSDASFAAVNLLVRTRQVERATTLANIKEADFRPGLDRESIRRWDTALDALASYANGVAALVDPNAFAGTGASAASFGQSLASIAKSDAFTSHPGLADAITKIGDAAIKAGAGAKAQKIVEDANTGVQALLAQMSDMISSHAADGTEVGIIPTVSTNWNTRLAEIQQSFLATGANKSAISAQYADALDQRDASVSALRALKSSLERLAQTHADLAAGRAADTSTVLAQIVEYTKLAKGILDDLKKKP